MLEERARENQAEERNLNLSPLSSNEPNYVEEDVKPLITVREFEKLK